MTQVFVTGNILYRQFPKLLSVTQCFGAVNLTQDGDRRAGPQLGVRALHHVDPRVGHGDGAQGESSGEDVDRRPAAVTGENRLLLPEPGEDEGVSHGPAAPPQGRRRGQRQLHCVPNYSRVDGGLDLHSA